MSDLCHLAMTDMMQQFGLAMHHSSAAGRNTQSIKDNYHGKNG